MKLRILYFLNLVCFWSFAQDPEIKPELPNLIPPSPTVAALMKYEEIPVNNYTGIPDISVPLFSHQFPSSKLGVNVGLSYHSSCTKLDEVASDVGLGWSLTSGGSVSRVVRGYPDEYYVPSEKFGIYKSTGSVNYYNALEGLVTPSVNEEIVREFLFDTDAKGKYDTSHDLWQFNFHGNTGRFYIEKQANNTLEVKLLENTTLKIINHYVPNSSGENIYNIYKPIGFTIFDEFGNKFVFDVIEITSSSNFNETTSQIGNMNSSVSGYNFNSAFHLSKVYDSNGNLLINYIYESGGNEQIRSSSVINYYPWYNVSDEMNNIISVAGNIYGVSFLENLYKPLNSLSISTNSYEPKKIKEIEMKDTGKVIFSYETGRNDEDYFNGADSRVLKGVTIKNFQDSIVNSFSFTHNYNYAIKLKMFLTKITQTKNNLSIDYKKFSYRMPAYIPNPIKDAWGYLKDLDCESFISNDREADPNNVSMFVLEKITHPTGGSTVLEYESNSYSAIEDELLTDFDDNPLNWVKRQRSASITSVNGGSATLFRQTTAGNVLFSVSINFPSEDWYISVYRNSISNENRVWGLTAFNMAQPNDCGYYLAQNLQPGDYIVTFSMGENLPSNTIGNATIGVVYRDKVRPQEYRNYLLGGGIRIKKVSHYEEDVDLDELYNYIPKKSNYFNYNYFDSNLNAHSSGALISKKPLFSYSTIKNRATVRLSVQAGSAMEFPARDHIYDAFSLFDVRSSGKTKGADVGYKNVSVSDLYNGKVNYVYSNSLDYPDIDSSSPPRFIPPVSFDYKRGLLLQESVFDQNDKVLSQTINNYSFDEYLLTTGISIFGTYDGGFNSYPTYQLFNDYNHLKTLLQLGNYCTGGNLQNYCGIGEIFQTFGNQLIIGFNFNKEAYGWAKLTNKTTKNYFYPNGSSTPNIVEVNETYAYNPVNKKISESTVTNSQGETLTTKYFYHTGNSIHSQNRISEIERIETYRGSELLSKSQINYNNNWGNNVSYLPQTIVTAKGSENLEARLHYLKYDEYSHPLEVKQENGIHICYIWGYNQTQPIAKIENATYAQVEQYVANLQTLSNGNNEQNLINALNNLRTALPNAMVTTYTYKPLIGISTVTDPKGNKQTYHYDPFNRLEFVKDKDDNILSENQYHYRTQN